MTRRQLQRRIRARSPRDERGFSLIEAMIALTIIFASLTALAFTATQGFKYAALARERQAATGIADSVMESVRALAWARLVQGVLPEDVAVGVDTTGNVLWCGSPPAPYFKLWASATCTNATDPTKLQKIVTTPNLPVNVCNPGIPCPLVPNHGTVQGQHSGATYDWYVYVTNPSLSSYSVYVYVSWTLPQLGGAVQSILTETEFTNPVGCVSSDVHPFAGPCQAQLSGVGSATQGGITITNGPSNISSGFSQASLFLPGARSDGLMEQVPKLSTTSTAGGIEVTTSGVTTPWGLAQVSTTADGNPTTLGVTEYGASTPTAYTASGPGDYAGGNNATLRLGFGGSDTLAGTSAARPGNSSPCPSASGVFTQQTDGNPCAASWARQGGSSPMSAVIDLSGMGSAVPFTVTSTLASIATSTQQYTFASLTDRLTLATDATDAIRQTVQRNLGTVTLFTFPSACTMPTGWDNSKGLIQITNYRDSAIATAGPSAVSATAAVQTAGGGNNAATLSYYNGSGYGTIAGNTFRTLTLPTALGLPTGGASCSMPLGGQTLTVSLTFPAETGIPGYGGKNEKFTTSADGVRSAQAQVMSPVAGTVRYLVTYGTQTKVDLLVSIDFGTIVAKAGYTPAPSGG